MTSAWWQTEWVWTATGWILVAAGVLLLVWALFADRAKGRPRCPKCWYDLAGVPRQARQGSETADPIVCPECGRRITRERQLLRTRRKWRPALGAVVLLILGYAALHVMAYRDGGWVRLVPTSLLILIAPADAGGGAAAGPYGGGGLLSGAGSMLMPGWTPPPPTMSERLESEVWRRVRAGAMRAWQSQWFIDRVLRETRIDLGANVLVPARWVVGEPIPVLIKPRPDNGLLGLQLQPGWDVVMPPSSEPRLTEHAAPSSIPARTEMAIGVVLTCTNGSVYSKTIVRPIEIVALHAQILRPNETPETTRRARLALDPRLCVAPDGNVTVVLDDRSPRPRWRSVRFGLGCAVEVRFDGQRAGTCTYRPQWTREVFKDWHEPEIAWAPGMLEKVRAAPERATLHVRGHPPESWEAYREWPFVNTDAECWAGEFVVEGRVVTRPEKFEDDPAPQPESTP